MTCQNTLPSFKELQAVFVDVDQTLLDFDASARKALETAFARNGLSFDEQMFETFLQVNARLWDQVEEGTLSREELNRIRFPRLFEAWNLSVQDPSAFESCFLQVLGQEVFLMPEAMEGIDRLKQAGLALFVISNGDSFGQRRRLEKAGLLSKFEDVYTSRDLGCSKPDPAFFQEALARSSKKLGRPLEAGRVLVIGDSFKADILGAMSLEMPAFWLRANRKYDPFEPGELQNAVPVFSWQQILLRLEEQMEDSKSDESGK